MDFPRKEVPELDPKLPIRFQITDIYVPESDKNRTKKLYDEEQDVYTMLIYGSTLNGETVSVNVENYNPYFFVKGPAEWDDLSEKEYDNKVEKLQTTLLYEKYDAVWNGKKYSKKIIPKYLEEHFVKLEKIKKKEFWGFTNNKLFNYIKVEVKSLLLFNGLKYYFNSLKKDGFKLYESNIDPFLRYIHNQNIKPCGWVEISNYKVTDNNTRCDYNITINHTDITPLDINKISPLLIASFDIECTSSHGDFPLAKKDYKKVVQDITAVSKVGYDIDKECFIYWIQQIFKQDIIIEPSLIINKVYPKKNVDMTNILDDFLSHTTGLVWEKISENDTSSLIELKSNKLGLELFNNKKEFTQDEFKTFNIKTNVNISNFVKYNNSYFKPINYITEIINILDKISDETDNDDDDDNDDSIKTKKLNISELNRLEDRLNKILTSILPELLGDEIIQIGTTVHRYGSDEIIYRNIVSLNSCDSIENCDIIECKTEKQLIREWKKIIQALNPDVLIGYNIFGFDMDYIWLRTIELNMNEEFSEGLGRKIDRKCGLFKQELSSSALGENILKYFDMDGMIIIDLFKVMQKDHKLDSYKLDNVASIFLGDKKEDLKPKELFERFKGNSSDRCVIAKYCIQDCALVNRLLHKLKILENNIGMGNVCLVPLNFLFRRGQGIKIFSLIAKQCMEKNFLIPVINNYDNLDIDADGYEGAVVLDPKEGMYLNDPIVVFDYGSLYPSSMIARDLSHDRYVLDDKYIIDDPNIEYINVYYDLYEGVGDKKRKVGVKKCKFAQIKDENGNQKRGIIAEILMMLLAERKNTRKKIEYKTVYLNNATYTGFINEKNDIVSIIDIDKNNTVTVNKNDIIEIKDTYSKFEQDVFDALQLAYKVTANSLYGQIGARTSPIYLKDIAACTTATGREMIMTAKKYVEDNYNAEVIYGDTDSIFCKFPLKDKNNNPVYGKQALEYAIDVGKDVEKNISKIMPFPQKLNYEKSLYPFIIFSKKRYVGNLYEFDVNSFKQKSMGIVLKRRDNANIVKKIYGGLINILLNKQNLNESIEFLNDSLDDLVNGKANINDLVISKTLKGSYKDPSKIAHKVLADRIASRDPGNKPATNDRIPYVYIKLPYVDKTTLQGDRIENPEYILENKITPDYLHYITNQIMKPVLQLYALCLEDLPNYDKDNDYWSKVENDLKDKSPIYLDNNKRKNRIENLRLQMVKELLFDKFIDRLSEPKQKKQKKKHIENLEISTNEKKIISNLNDNIIVDVKITKKNNSTTLDTKCKIVKDKKTIWSYDNYTGKDKKLHTIKVICDIIDYFKNNNITDNIINIKLNNKTFVKEYKSVLVNYNAFVKNEKNNSNLIEKAIKYEGLETMNDIDMLNKSINVGCFEKLILISDKFKFVSD